MKIGRKALAVASIVLATASAVIAQEDKWDFEVTPYLWLAGIDGDVTVGGNKADIDMEFDDIFESVDAGGGLMATAQRGSFVIWGQYDYVGMDSDKLDNAPAGGSVQTDSFLGALAGGYQFQTPLEGFTIDLMGGVRYAWMNSEVEITGVGSGEDSVDIVDGIAVVRPMLRVAQKWRFDFLFDIGAGDSDLVWEVQPSVQYQLCHSLGLRLGYRYLHYDVEGEAGNTFDAAFHGLILGASLLF